MQSEECTTCPLFQHFTTQRVPEGAELACAVYRKLNRSAVSRFGLQHEAWAALGLDLEPEEMDELIDQLSAYDDGVKQAVAQIEAQRAAKK
jgi:hypothetical protein